MPDEIVVDARSFETLGREMNRAAERLGAMLQPTLMATAEEVAAEARVIAGEHSSSIPERIHVAEAPFAAVVRAEGALAGAFELGNKGKRRSDPMFRHPVFGHRDRWVDQPRFRFLAPALAVDRRRITKRLVNAWDLALEEAGLRARWDTEG